MKYLNILFFGFVMLVIYYIIMDKERHIELPKLFQKLVKFNAITLPPFGMFYINGRWNNNTIKHEIIHWEQYKRLGFFGFYINYLYLSWKYGYLNNPMEIEAYEA